MPKTASVFTRVDPRIKEQAEAVLEQLGISMSTAMGIFLQQIVLQRGIPFEMKLPQNKPTAFASLSDEEFNALMDQAARSYATGNYIEIGQFENEMRRDMK